MFMYSKAWLTTEHMLDIQIILKDDLQNIIPVNQDLQNIELHLSYYLKKYLKIKWRQKNVNYGGKVLLGEEN